MAFIKVIGENEATGKLSETYDEIQKSRGRLSNILRIQSLDPKALSSHLNLYLTLLFGKGPLSRLDRELLAVVVSVVNGCDYCHTHHGEAFLSHAKDPEFLAGIKKNLDHPKLDAKGRALIQFAVGLTKTPGAGRKEAVDALRKVGCSDEEILQATQIIAYFNFVNRLSSGLGVELEDAEIRDYKY